MHFLGARGTAAGLVSGWLIAIFTAPVAHAGLAITEVMSYASESSSMGLVLAGPDYVEITNYGSDPIDVSRYSMGDGTSNPERTAFRELGVLRTNEVVIIFRERLNGPYPTVEGFREWWGIPETNSLRIFIWTAGFGLNDAGDQVTIWDGDSNVVDMVVFPPSSEGRSIIPNPVTGLLTSSCRAGFDGGFWAATRDDCGSPGIAPPPIPLECVETPQSALKCVGARATFCGLVGGLPRPRYQWMFDEQAIAGATEPCYTISAVDPGHAGSYSLHASNCLGELVVCGPALLSITDEPFAPMIVSAPEDIEAFDGQTVNLEVVVNACPVPTFQWSRGGVPIPGATDSVLQFSVNLGMDGEQYTVDLDHDLGSASFTVKLSVIPKDALLITEVMAWSNQTLPGDPDHEDWLELTNTNTTRAVNLKGYRIHDSPVLSLADRIEEDVVLQPGESAILVENLSPAEFRRWWGEEMLPPTLKIITFHGFGFSSTGDTAHLWNAAAKRDEGFSVTISFTFLFDEERGHTWECGLEEDYQEFCLYTSSEGVHGAFVSAEGGDVGSPGVWGEVPKPFVRLKRVDSSVRIRCRVFPERSYRLLQTDELRLGGAIEWQPVPGVGTIDGRAEWVEIDQPMPTGLATRFYQLREL